MYMLIKVLGTGQALGAVPGKKFFRVQELDPAVTEGGAGSPDNFVYAAVGSELERILLPGLAEEIPGVRVSPKSEATLSAAKSQLGELAVDLRGLFEGRDRGGQVGLVLAIDPGVISLLPSG